MVRFKRWIRHYFGFSRREANGFLVVLGLLIILLLTPVVYSAWPVASEGAVADDQQRLDSLVALLQENSPVEETSRPVRLQLFDPNTASQELLETVGIVPEIATRIIRYREKGGHFRVKKDVRKIYGFPRTLYDTLYPYIDLPEKQLVSGEKAKQKFSKEVSPTVSFDLNEADTARLMTVRGIGPVYAARIVKYRALLGGFVDASQLLEVYGLSPEVVDRLTAVSFIDAGFKPQQISVHTANKWQLRRHPYISDSLAQALVTMREKDRLTAGSDVFALPEPRKVLPYLDFDAGANE